MTRQSKVLVLNHFAVPRDQPGGTRHTELFGRLTNWDYSIVAANRNLTTGEVQGRSPHFAFVRVPSYDGNGMGRIASWLVFAVQSVVVGLFARPTVVYASSPHLLAGLAGWVIARLRRAPFVLEVRDLWPQVLVDMGHLAQSSRLFRLLRIVELFLYRHADGVVSMAPGTTTELAKAGVPAHKVAYLPNAADPGDFRPSSDRASLRVRYGFSRLTGIYAGAHGPANGLDLLLDAAKDLENVDVDIVFVGDGIEKAKLVAAAAQRALTNVRFLPPVPKTEMPDLLAAADFGVHVLADVQLFRTAVSPNKVFDYMAASLPVLTNCPGVVGDMVAAAEAGWVVNPEALAPGIRDLASLDQRELERLGKNGTTWLSANFTRSSVAGNLEQLLDSMAMTGGGGR